MPSLFYYPQLKARAQIRLIRIMSLPNSIPKFTLLIFVLWIACLTLVQAQCTQAVADCETYLAPFEPVSGRYFRAEVFPYDHAKLRMQFEFDRFYRVIPCGRSDKGETPVFNLYNRAGILVFSSSNNPNQGVFDFEFGESGQYTIVAGYESGGGCVAFVIGYLLKNSPQANSGSIRPLSIKQP